MQAIVLAAGQGTRLRAVSPSKPLTPVAGRPLIHRVLDNLAAAGVTHSLVVTGYHSDAVAAAVAAWPGAGATTLFNPRWAGPNGISVLAAAAALEARALLVMADHLAGPGLYAAVASSAHPGLTLGVDRRLGHAWVDEADVTRVATRQGRITAIGKQLLTYDAYDSGVFLITPELTAALALLPSPALSDGVRILAASGRAHVVDVSAHHWIDIDDPRALAAAQAWAARDC